MKSTGLVSSWQVQNAAQRSLRSVNLMFEYAAPDHQKFVPEPWVDCSAGPGNGPFHVCVVISAVDHKEEVVAFNARRSPLLKRR